MRSLSPEARTRSSPRTLIKSPQVEIAQPQMVPPGLQAGLGGGAAQDQAHAEEAQIVRDAWGEAEKLLAEAKREADALQQASHQRAEALYKESQDRGYRTGMARAKHEVAEKVDRLMSLVEGAARATEELLRSSEPQVIELAIEIAEKVIGRELAADRAIVADLARRALERAGVSATYYLRVNPADAQVVREYLQRDLAEIKCEIVADQRIEEGGCVIVTSHGHVDAQVGSQLAEVRTALLGEGDPHDH